MALSGRILGLKFMQRALTKQKEAETPVESEPQVAEHTTETAKTRCVVIEEGDPPPTASQSGRLSFKVPGPDNNDKKAPSPSPRTDHDTTNITDEDMATLLANSKEQEKRVDRDKDKIKKKANSVSTKRKKSEQQEEEEEGKAALLGPVGPLKWKKNRKEKQ